MVVAYLSATGTVPLVRIQFFPDDYKIYYVDVVGPSSTPIETINERVKQIAGELAHRGQRRLDLRRRRRHDAQSRRRAGERGHGLRALRGDACGHPGWPRQRLMRRQWVRINAWTEAGCQRCASRISYPVE